MLIPRRNEFDVFDDFFRGDNFFSRRDNSIMKTDIIEKKDEYVIEMDLPGYEKENINIELNDGYLEISAKTVRDENSKESEKYVHKERFFGQCSRNFYLGDSIEQDIHAEFKNGILKVVIPKKEDNKDLPEVKRIEIE